MPFVQIWRKLSLRILSRPSYRRWQILWLSRACSMCDRNACTFQLPRVLACPWEKIWRYGWNDSSNRTQGSPGENHFFWQHFLSPYLLWPNHCFPAFIPTYMQWENIPSVIRQDRVIDQAVALIRPSLHSFTIFLL